MNKAELSIEQLIADGVSLDDIITIVKAEQSRQNKEKEEELQIYREEIASEIVDYLELLIDKKLSNADRINFEKGIVNEFKAKEKDLLDFITAEKIFKGRSINLKPTQISKSDDKIINSFLKQLEELDKKINKREIQF